MKENQEKMSKIKITPHYQVREKKINYISILTHLNEMGYLSEDNFSFLADYFPETSEIFKDINEIMEFAVILHIFSPDGYICAQNTIEKLLPDTTEFSEKYIQSDGKPGFTKESLEAIKRKVDGSSPKKLFCSMVINDIQLSKDRNSYADLGNGFDCDTVLARDSFVIMLNCLNGNWSVPLGYFLIAQLEVASRCVLIKMAIELSQKIGVQIVSLTVNEQPESKALLTKLGCILRKNIPKKTWFEFNGKNIFVFFDTFRMMRSVYLNLFSKKSFFYSNIKAILWMYIENIEKITKPELNLLLIKANPKRHVFSDEIVDVINICNKMNLDEFKSSFQTLDFILHLNKIHRTFRELVETEGKDQKFHFFRQLEVFTGRISHLNKTSFQESHGMSGILLNCLSLKTMASYLKSELDYIPAKKLSLYQLDMFSDLIRFYSNNDMPTGIQFKKAYRKLMIFLEPENLMETISFAHCLENIRPENIIKSSSSKDGFEVDDKFHYFYDRNINSKGIYDMISEYQIGKIICEVTEKLINTINCAKCIGNMIINQDNKNHNLTFVKKTRVYPSQDVVWICNKTESLFRKIVLKVDSDFKISIKKMMGKKFVEVTLMELARIVFKYFSDKNVFESLAKHCLEQSVMENHRILLIKAVALNYVEKRMNLNLN